MSNSFHAVIFSDSYVWNGLIQLIILCVAILVGNILRTRVGFLKKLLIPSSLLGGLLLLLIKAIPTSEPLIDAEFMQIVTYHCLGLGFAALTLKTAKAQRMTSPMKIAESGVIMAGSYLLQAIVGLIVSLAFYFGCSYFYGAGLILPMGYGQGTGSALSWGSKYETSYGFTGGASYGLAVATIGFLVGSIVGVVFLNVLLRRGKVHFRKKRQEENHMEDFVRENEIPNSESIDKLSVQICFVAIAYLAAFGFMSLLRATGVSFLNDLSWGLNFLWSLAFAFLLKTFLAALNAKGVVKRYYINNYLMDRISGWMFDLMIVAGVAAIDFEDIRINLPLLIVTCVAGGVATFVYVFYATKHAYKNYETESFLTNFGTVTGTVSTGIILLREINPDFVTPAADNIVLQNIPSVILIAPLLLTLNFAAQSLTAALIMLGVYLVLFVSYNVFLFRRRIFKKKYQNRPDDVWTEPTEDVHEEP